MKKYLVLFASLLLFGFTLFAGNVPKNVLAVACSAPTASFNNDGFGFIVDGPCALSHYTPTYCDESTGVKVEGGALSSQDTDNDEDDFATVLSKEIKSIAWKAGQYEGVAERECDPTDDPSDDKPSMSSEVSCGAVDLTFRNPTGFFFSFDYRVDNEAGTDDQYTNMQIAGGPWAGMYFGQRFNIVDVSAGTNEYRTVNFAEDSGMHEVAYRLWRGAENDWYLDWVTVEVESDCNANPTPEPTPNPDVCLNLDGIQTSVPNDYHLDASGKNCVQFGQPGSPTDSGIGGGQVLGTSTGQVLGTSTMAATGGAMDAIFYSMFTFGSLLTSFGIMKNGKKAQI